MIRLSLVKNTQRVPGLPPRQ